MTEDSRAGGPLEIDEAPQRRRVWRGPWRSIVFPVLVVAAIAAAIWWLEYRDDGSSGGGTRYGPVAMPPALATEGLEIEAKEGALAPDFLLEMLEGDELRFSDLRGRPVVVNLWATWCSPCRKEMPQFVEAYDRYEDEGLEIIALNVQESPSIIQPFVDDFGIDFPVALDKNGRVSDDYRILGLPMTYFVDREGVIRGVFQGPFEERLRGTQVQGAIERDDLTARIEEILE